MARLAYAQKPPEFSNENEFRFVLICKASPHDLLTVRIGRRLDLLYNAFVCLVIHSNRGSKT